MRREEMSMGFTFPKPGKVLLGVMAAMAGIWVALAIALNWLGASQAWVLPFLGDTQAVLHGQLWRLFTAPFIHLWTSPGHLLTTLLGLYFLGTSLESRFTPRGLLAFLVGSAAFAFALQVVVGALLPEHLGASAWFGGLGMVEAIAVAWALSFRGQTVRLFFVLPVTGTMLLAFILVMSILNVLAQNGTPEGLVTPFGGMLAGYLFGGATSPLRSLWRKLRFGGRRAGAPASRGRAKVHGLRVIHGGGKDEPPKDPRYLN